MEAAPSLYGSGINYLMPSEKVPFPVSIVRCPDYSPERVHETVIRCLEPLGGIRAFVQPGARVLLKPNLLSPHPPEAAVCTHPEIVRAVAKLVLEAGGRPFLGDSPAVASMSRVLKGSGIDEVVRELGVDPICFATSVKVPVPGNRRRRFLFLAREALGFDLIINLPRFKTHSRMVLTLSVKNMFGSVVGTEKAGWHLKAEGTEAFADLLLDVYQALNPGLSILDGITAMEGNGPSSGDPFKLGLVFASPSGLALDRVAGEVAGVPVGRHPVLKQAFKRGLKGLKPEEFSITGPDVGEIRRPFSLPPGVSGIEDRLPSWVKRPLKRSINIFPFLQGEKCVSCGQCADVCPVKAIVLFKSGRGGGIVRKSECISCFCCQEACPHGAIDLVPGRLLRLLRGMGLA